MFETWLGTPSGILALTLGLLFLVMLFLWSRNRGRKNRHGRRALNRRVVQREAAVRLVRQHRMAHWHARGRYGQVATALGLLFVVALLFALNNYTAPAPMIRQASPSLVEPVRVIPLDKQVATPAPVAPIVKVDLPPPAPAPVVVTPPPTPAQTVEVSVKAKPKVVYRTRVIRKTVVKRVRTTPRTVVYDNRIYDNRTTNNYYTAPPAQTYVATPRYPEEPRANEMRRYYY
ncbi:MAG TPA: hypothetical protein VHP58_05420 [Alphaproteobacteria bacterium]|nr:hypothetical protein [Alphaproteobacteria bacterium]